VRCEICKKRVKENTEGKKGYCQGHSIFSKEVMEQEKRNDKS